MIRPGQRFADRFLIEREAGRGGMGVVYAADDAVTSRRVAVKVMASSTPLDLARFMREAATLETLRAPGVVEHIAHGKAEGGMAYLAMEWLEGEDLAARLLRGPLELDDALRVAEGVARALTGAHAQKLIHRDIKPSNIFLVERDTANVKLLDFGIARSQAPGGTLTATGSVVGTPHYMAPEQVRGDRLIDARADVCALGWVLFECISGRRRFPAEHALEILASVLLEEPPRLRDVMPSVPAAVDSLVARMTARERSLRPADAAAVLLELASVRRAADGSQTQPSAAPLPGNERRFVSLIVATRVAAEEDATLDVPNNLTRREALRARALDFGAVVELVGTDCVLAVIDRGGTAREQAERAVKLAHALSSEAACDTVRVVSGVAVMQGSMPAGELVRRALELPSTSRTGETPKRRIQLDELTANLVAGAFDVTMEEDGPSVRGERGALDRGGGDARRRRLRRAGSGRFVGREREMALIEATLSGAVDESELRALLVVAPPGLGKSRLVAEIAASAARRGDVQVIGVRADASAAGSPHRVLGAVVSELARVTSAAPEAKRAAIEEAASRAFDGADAARASAVLASLIHAAARPADEELLRASREDPLLHASLVTRYVRGLVTAACERTPLVVILEDMQWGDLPSVDVFASVGTALRDHPLALVATARPEIDERFASFWSTLPLERIGLGPLGRKPAERLVREHLGPTPSGIIDVDAVVRAILDRAEGSPLFLEELALAAGEGDTMPATVFATLQARLDAMGDDARRVLRAASVFGDRAWPAGIRAVLGVLDGDGGVDTTLDLLEERGVLAVRAASSIAGEREHEVRSSLLREAAYALWSDADRAGAHARAAEWLVMVGESDPVILARHFDQAGLRERAARYWLEAARTALGGSDLAGAMEYAGRARAGTSSPELVTDVDLVELEALFHRKDLAQAEELALAARDRAPRGSDRWLRASTSVIVTAGQRGHNDVVVRIAEELSREPIPTGEGRYLLAGALGRALTQLRIAKTGADETLMWERVRQLEAAAGPMPAQIRAFIARARGIEAVHADRIEESVAHFQAGVDASEELTDWRGTALARTSVAGMLGMLGDFDRGEAVARQAMLDAERAGSPYFVEWGRYVVGKLRIMRGAWQGGLDEFLHTAESLRDTPRLASGSHMYAARALEALGRVAEAEAHANLALERASSVPIRAAALAALARVRLAQRNPAAAGELSTKAYELAETSGGMEDDFEVLARVVHAEALEALGRRDEARAVIEKARDQLSARAERLSTASLREAYLTRSVELARVMRYAREWIDRSA